MSDMESSMAINNNNKYCSISKLYYSFFYLRAAAANAKPALACVMPCEVRAIALPLRSVRAVG